MNFGLKPRSTYTDPSATFELISKVGETFRGSAQPSYPMKPRNFSHQSRQTLNNQWIFWETRPAAARDRERMVSIKLSIKRHPSPFDLEKEMNAGKTTLA